MQSRIFLNSSGGAGFADDCRVRSLLLSVLGLFGMAACGNEIMAPGLNDRRVTIADDGDRDNGDSGPSGGDPAPGDNGPAATPIVTALVADSPVTQSAFAGAEVDDAPSVIVRDQFGNPMAGQAVHFTLEAGGGVLDPPVVTTDAQGKATVTSWVLGKRVAPNQVRAALDAAPGITPVSFDATILTDYTITVRFLTSVTTTQRAAFENAAARWSAVIVGDLEDFQIARSQLPNGCANSSDATPISVDDTIIFASVQPIDGQGGILAQAAPCIGHDLGGIAVGVMSFDSDDLAFLESNNVLEGTILHEMGHVIGIGSLWSMNGLVMSPSIGSAGANTRFTGDAAAQAYVDLGGTGFTGTVPVENNGVQGSADAHWRESIFRNELMSPSINGMEPNLPMSAVTVASLKDLGAYEVNDLAADEFMFPMALTAEGPPLPPLGECQVVSPSEQHPLGGGIVELR